MNIESHVEHPIKYFCKYVSLCLVANIVRLFDYLLGIILK